MESSVDKTRAIVLNTTPINDHTQFVHLYSEKAGRVTCRVPITSRGKRANQMRTLMTPMTMLELVLGGKPTDEIRSISEVQLLQSPFMAAMSQPGKTVQYQYMAELIVHTVREQEANPRLWKYLSLSLELLSVCEDGWANFHLIFTSGLISELGFGIDTSDYEPGSCFDLTECAFVRQPIAHPRYFNEVSTQWFCRILDTSFAEMAQLSLNRQQRAALLDMLLTFIAYQIPEMGQLRSVEILRTLFD